MALEEVLKIFEIDNIALCIQELDQTKHKELIGVTFQKELRDDYYSSLMAIGAIVYVDKSYLNAATVIPPEKGMPAHLDLIAVHPECQEKGMGTQLVKEILDDNGNKLNIRVKASNKAIKLYERVCHEMGLLFEKVLFLGPGSRAYYACFINHTNDEKGLAYNYIFNRQSNFK